MEAAECQLLVGEEVWPNLPVQHDEHRTTSRRKRE